MDNIDLADFDASFFEISGGEATSMDPNHRQMLEVVYEGLENAGFPLEKLDGAPVGCFVGSFMSGKLYSPSKETFKYGMADFHRLWRYAE